MASFDGVLRVGEKGEVARTGVFDAGDATRDVPSPSRRIAELRKAVAASSSGREVLEAS